jgi:ligand-binding sensor domain-containing protein
MRPLFHRKGIIAVLIFISSSIIPTANCQWTQYTWSTTSGINNGIAYSVLQDENNLVWLGTDRGLSCFNPAKSSWKLFTTENGLIDNYINCVFEDRNGSVWIATNKGISRFSNGMFTNYTEENGLASNVVRAIAQSPAGTLYFGTCGEGVCSYTPESGFKKITTHINGDSCILSLLAISDTALLIGTFTRGLILYQNDSAKSINNPPDMKGKIVYALYGNADGDIWIGTDQGAQQYDPLENTVLPVPDSLKGKTVYSITGNDSGDLLFGTYNRMYRFANGSWSPVIPDNLAKSANFYSLLYDSDGALWACSSSQGLFIFDGQVWISSRLNGLFENEVYSVCEDRNQKLWFGTRHDIYSYDGKFWIKVPGPENADNYYPSFGKIVSDKKGYIWGIRSYNEIYRYNGQNWKSYSVDTFFDYGQVTNLAADSGGNIWFTTWNSGIYRFDGEVWSHYTMADGLGNDNNITIDFFSDGRLVTLSWDGVLSYFDGNTWSSEVIAGMRDYYDLKVDDQDNIWMPSSGGLLKYRNSMIEERLRGGDDILKINIDKSGNLWAVTSSNNLMRYDGINWKIFSEKDGLFCNRIYSIFFDSDGYTWLTTDNGVFVSDFVTRISNNESDNQGINVSPNPCSGLIQLQYNCGKPGEAVIQFASLDGRLVEQASEHFQPGRNTLHFNSSGWPEGIIICTIRFNGMTSREKLVKISDQK